jgi:Protein of unknown function (DUF1569)
MRNIFEPSTSHEIKERLSRLRPESQRQWGKMNPAQVAAHLCKGMEQALGDVRPPRMLIGRLIGRFIKSKALGDDAPMIRNSPTVPGFVVLDERDFIAERDRLNGLIDRVITVGPTGCTAHPHSFFGHLTPEQWGILMYKHLDHHLRQFGV